MSDEQKPADVAELKRRMLAALEFKHQIGSHTYRLRLPTPLDERIAAARYAGHPDRSELWQRDVVRDAVIGWAGPKVADVAPGDPEADMELPCSPESVALLFEVRLDLYDALAGKLFERRKERTDVLEADAKNSSRASSGSESGTTRASKDASASTSTALPASAPATPSS